MIRSLIISSLLLFLGQLQAQFLWPGDINNNGEVNNVDLLYLGNAIGTIGPPRLDTGIEWEPKEITTLWPQIFPNGVNYAYADCNGDGIINYDDFAAIEVNYNLTHGVVMPDDFEPGVPGVSPLLGFLPPFGPVFEGDVTLLPLFFGEEIMPVENFYGIAYTINYDPSIAFLEFNPFFDSENFDEDWLDIDNPDPPLFSFQFDPVEGKIEVAISRIDGTASPDNFGAFGAFLIVIEDNVVGLGVDDIETELVISDIKLFDETGLSTPVLGDSIVLTIYNDDLVNDHHLEWEQTVQVYPNPIDHQLVVESENASIEHIELVSLIGQRVGFSPIAGSYQYTIATERFASGVYQLQIQTSKGMLTKKIIIQH